MKHHRDKILELIKKSKVVTSSEVAKFLKVSWNTADSYLKELIIEGKLWEIKIRIHGKQHRIFYVVLKGNEMILLHAYLKKTQKAPIKEIEVAKQRMKTVTGG